LGIEFKGLLLVGGHPRSRVSIHRCYERVPDRGVPEEREDVIGAVLDRGYGLEHLRGGSLAAPATRSPIRPTAKPIAAAAEDLAAAIGLVEGCLEVSLTGARARYPSKGI